MRQELEDLAQRWPLARKLHLNMNSVVYVVGAYKGITVDLINELYHPKLIRAYEPQPWACKVLNEIAMAHPENMEAYNYGLGDHAGVEEMGEWFTDACSFINTGPDAREHGKGMLVPADWAMDDMPVIDLMVINIEGYEFTLLPYLCQTRALNKVKQLAIQWHIDLAPGLDKANMDIAIGSLGMEGFALEIDERPSWTYHVRNS